MTINKVNVLPFLIFFLLTTEGYPVVVCVSHWPVWKSRICHIQSQDHQGGRRSHLTGGTFKTRWYGHMNNIRNYDPEDGSYGKRMSRYVGDLNSRKIPNTITWSIVSLYWWLQTETSEWIIMSRNWINSLNLNCTEQVFTTQNQFTQN